MTEIGTNIKLKEFLGLTKFLVTVTRLTRCVRQLLMLTERVRLLIQRSGRPMAVAYLKQTVVDVYHVLAGTPRERWSGQGPVVAIDSQGLPKIIPHRLRTAISNRDIRVIKVVLTILSLYRVLKVDSFLNLSTITRPSQCLGLPSQAEVSEVIRTTLPKFRTELGTWKALNLVTAGPNSGLSIRTASLDAAGFLLRPRLFWALAQIQPILVSIWMTFCGLIALIILLLRFPAAFIIAYWRNDLPSNWKPNIRKYPFIWALNRIPILGRLATKVEAAGKVRVFAITDWWTQCALKGLHETIFSYLRTIRPDGTHDQLKPVRELVDYCRLGIPAFSFDLSAATDRFPVEFQEMVLCHFFGSRFARSWKQVLVNRKWRTPHEGDCGSGFAGISEFLTDNFVRYAVGQPMGAYSSWAVFALSHHVVVQMAAKRSGWIGWYPHYALLGDDIVIAGKGVADAYLALIRQLGVEVSAAKSVDSENGVVEFAKHLLGPYGDYSPIGTKALLGAYREGLYLPALYQDLRDKSFPISQQGVVEGLHKAASFYRGSLSKVNYLRGVSSILGPTGAFPESLLGWMSFDNQPAAIRGWLPPGLSQSLLWNISSIKQQVRDAQVSAIRDQISWFWGSWLGLDAALPGVLSLISPRFWAKALELIEAEIFVDEFYRSPRFAISTSELRERVRQGHSLSVTDVVEALVGIEFRPSPVTPEDATWAKLSRTLSKKASVLRSSTKLAWTRMHYDVIPKSNALVQWTEPVGPVRTPLWRKKWLIDNIYHSTPFHINHAAVFGDDDGWEAPEMSPFRGPPWH